MTRGGNFLMNRLNTCKIFFSLRDHFKNLLRDISIKGENLQKFYYAFESLVSFRDKRLVTEILNSNNSLKGLEISNLSAIGHRFEHCHTCVYNIRSQEYQKSVLLYSWNFSWIISK